MALKATVTTLDEVDEAHRPLYVESNGKFKLDVDADPGGALKTALQRERESNGTYKTRLKKLGIEEREDDEVSELLQLGEKAKQGLARSEDQIEQVKQQLTKTHQKELEKKVQQINELTTSLERVLRDDAAKTALVTNKGDVDLLLPHVQSKTAIVRDDDGNYVARVKGEKDGEFRLNDAGDPMSVDELVAEMRADKKFERAFEGSGGSGGGARPDTTGTIPLPEKGPKGDRMQRLKDQKRRNGSMSL